MSRLALLLTALLASAPAAARADDAIAGDRAVELGHAGLARYDARRFAEAYDLFEKAETLAHSPIFLLYMARSKRQLNELRVARDLFRRCATETLPADAPAAWSRAKQDAATEGDEVENLLPRLSITVAPPDAVLEVDAERMALRDGRATVTLDPGTHRLRATLGSKTITRTVELRPAARDAIALSFEPTTPPAEGEPGSLVPGVTLLAVGGAGLLAGIGTGAAAWAIADDIQSRCVGDSCLREDADDGDTLSVLTTASTVCFVAGGAIAAAGIVLVIVRPGGDAAATATARFGPGGAVVSVAF